MTLLDLDAGMQPRCPSCGIVMRDGDGASTCPDCGYSERHGDAVMPPEFVGPTINDG